MTALQKFVDQLPIRIKNAYSNEIEQALKEERQQVIDTFIEGSFVGEMFNNENRAYITDAEQYYEQISKNID